MKTIREKVKEQYGYDLDGIEEHLNYPKNFTARYEFEKGLIRITFNGKSFYIKNGVKLPRRFKKMASKIAWLYD